MLEVTKAALVHDCTALLAWSAQEAARYLETLKAYQRKPADLIKERSDGHFLTQLGECLTSVKPLNKTDVATLHATFGSLAKMIHASQHELALCPGLGEREGAKAEGDVYSAIRAKGGEGDSSGGGEQRRRSQRRGRLQVMVLDLVETIE